MRTLPPPWPADRLYACLEIDQFPAQALCAFLPSMRHEAFVVTRQDANSHKSTVWASSPAAKSMKVLPGTPLMEVRRRHPRVRIVGRRRRFETALVRELGAALSDFTPRFEVLASGSCLLDLIHTPSARRLPVAELVLAIREEVARRTNLAEIAVGVSRSRLIARMMAGLAGPNDIKICHPQEESQILSFMSTRFLPHLSPACREKLRRYGLQKVGQIRRIERSELIKRFGPEGEKLYCMARGIDFAPPVVLGTAPQAVYTLTRDINHIPSLKRCLHHVADRLCFYLENRRLLADRVMLKIQYTDRKTVQKTRKLGMYSHDVSTVFAVSCRLLDEVYRRRVALKSIRLQTRHCRPDRGQLSLFETGKEMKSRRFRKGIHAARQDHRFDILLSAGELGVSVSRRAKPLPEGKHGITIGDLFSCADTTGLSDWQRQKNVHIGTVAPPHPRDLHHLQRCFTFAEIVHTFNREPLVEDFLRIDRHGRAATLFSVKIHRAASQPRHPEAASGKAWMDRFVVAVAPLVESGRFYSFLIQLDAREHRSQAMLDYLLRTAARAARHHLDVHIEFPHPSWETEFVLRSLKDNGIGICNGNPRKTEANAPTEVLATTDKGYLRHSGCCHVPERLGERGGSRVVPHRCRHVYTDGEILENLGDQIGLSQKVHSLAVVYANLPPEAAVGNAIRNLRMWSRITEEARSSGNGQATGRSVARQRSP